eukprot:982598-Rhodomonas_salina.1
MYWREESYPVIRYASQAELILEADARNRRPFEQTEDASGDCQQDPRPGPNQLRFDPAQSAKVAEDDTVLGQAQQRSRRGPETRIEESMR